MRMACGVDADGRRDGLGGSVLLSEAEGHGWTFLSELKDRGLYGMKRIVSDAHEGLQAARRAMFPSVSWPRLPVSFAAQCRAVGTNGDAASCRGAAGDCRREIGG